VSDAVGTESTDDGSVVVARGRPLSGRIGRPLVTLVLAVTLAFLVVPVALTFVASFAAEWTGVLPSGFVTLDHWRYVLGLGGGVEDAARRSLRITEPADSPVVRSALLALAGVGVNLLVGVPIAYAVARYDFRGRSVVNALAILPLAPGIILGVAFLWAYPELSSETNIGLVVGYSLLKAPFMVMAVQSSFESMPLRQLEESARSLGASWPRAFLTVIVPHARQGILAGSIICWTLAAAEFNFSYIVQPRGSQPLALFLKAHITNSSFLTQAAAVSVFFLLVAGVTAALQAAGSNGFAVSSVTED
jgi:putative spermidine/putrescine transport system permease protein